METLWGSLCLLMGLMCVAHTLQGYAHGKENWMKRVWTPAPKQKQTGGGAGKWVMAGMRKLIK